MAMPATIPFWFWSRPQPSEAPQVVAITAPGEEKNTAAT